MPQEIIPNPEYEKLLQYIKLLQNDVADALLRRDHLVLIEGKIIESQYIAAIGSLECKVFEFDCEVRRLRRKTELIQLQVNRQETVSLEIIETKLDEELKEYSEKLNEKQKAVDWAMMILESKPLSEEKSEEFKKLYLKIVKQLHPDIHPNASKKELSLLHKAISAYEQGNFTMIQLIWESIQKICEKKESTNAIDELISQRNRLQKVKNKIYAKIRMIKNSWPFTIKAFLLNKVAVEKKRAELNQQLEEYRLLFEHYQEKIKKLLDN